MEKDKEREWMIQRLHDDKYWAFRAGGMLGSSSTYSCPICGCDVNYNFKDIHIIWHERNNQ